MPTESQPHIVLSCVIVPVRRVAPACKTNIKVDNNKLETSLYTLSLFYCHEFQRSSCSLTKAATVLQPSFPPTRTEWCFCITLKFMIHVCVSNWLRGESGDVHVRSNAPSVTKIPQFLSFMLWSSHPADRSDSGVMELLALSESLLVLEYHTGSGWPVTSSADVSALYVPFASAEEKPCLMTHLAGFNCSCCSHLLRDKNEWIGLPIIVPHSWGPLPVFWPLLPIVMVICFKSL